MAEHPLSAPPRLPAGPGRARRLVTAAAVCALTAVLAGGCGYGSKGAVTTAPAAVPSSTTGPTLSASTVRIGYFANLTHATPLIGMESGRFAADLGSTRIQAQIFAAGPSEVEALDAGAVDIAWMGPSPAVNAYVKSHGTALKIISGATSGGAELVVAPGITSIADLRGRTIASPQLGNTQDVALLDFLAGHGFRENSESGAGDVSVVRTDNSLTPTEFADHRLDGAWVPEPTASELVAEGGHVLVNERSLWPGGQFTTTDMIVSDSFLRAHPDVVRAVLNASVDTNAWIQAHPALAEADADAALKALTGRALPAAVLSAAWSDLTVTDDPLASTLRTEAAHAVAVGLLKQPDLSGIYDLAPLDAVLAAHGLPAVSAAGLGTP